LESKDFVFCLILNLDRKILIKPMKAVIRNIKEIGLKCVVVAALVGSIYSAKAQSRGENLDEAKVGSYTLPDPLIATNGKRIKSAEEWTKSRRPEVLQLFSDHVYGKFPGRPEGLHYQVNSVDEALGGRAIRKQVTVHFGSDNGGPGMEILLYLPKGAKKPVPVFAGLNFYGNHTVNADPGIRVSTRWQQSRTDGSVVNNRATEAGRGLFSKSFPIEEILSGWLWVCYCILWRPRT
jgi:hypothetical protein